MGWGGDKGVRGILGYGEMGIWGYSSYPGLFSPPFRARGQFAIKSQQALTRFCHKCQNSDGTLRNGRVVPHPAPKEIKKTKKTFSELLADASRITPTSITTHFHLSKSSHLPYKKIKNIRESLHLTRTWRQIFKITCGAIPVPFWCAGFWTTTFRRD